MALVLASSSPRRVELLRQLGIDPIVRPADIDESVIDGELPAAYVERLARAKCRRIVGSVDELDLVIAADTTVSIDGRILGKPENRTELIEFLLTLSGRSHDVYTGVAVATGGRVVAGVEHTTVVFAALSGSDIEWYADLDEPYDKAGGYALQGAGGLLVRGVDGSVDNVVGLPRRLVADLFEDVGFRITDFVRPTGTLDG